LSPSPPRRKSSLFNKKHKSFRTSVYDHSAAAGNRGWLDKLSSGIRPRWAERYFVQHTHYLQYFKTQAACEAEGAQPKGMLDLRAVEEIALQGRELHVHIAGGEGTMKLRAPDRMQAEAWQEALRLGGKRGKVERGAASFAKTRAASARPPAPAGAKSRQSEHGHEESASEDEEEDADAASDCGGEGGQAGAEADVGADADEAEVEEGEDEGAPEGEDEGADAASDCGGEGVEAEAEVDAEEERLAAKAAAAKAEEEKQQVVPKVDQLAEALGQGQSAAADQGVDEAAASFAAMLKHADVQPGADGIPVVSFALALESTFLDSEVRDIASPAWSSCV
jgi:hypothetical protein